MNDYHQLLINAKIAYDKYRTKKMAAHLAAFDAAVCERHLSNLEREKLKERLMKDLLDKDS